MIGLTARTKDETDTVLRKAQKASIESLGHAAAVIRLTARRSIRQRPGPSPAGKPPHTHTKRLPKSILYAVDKQIGEAVIGPDVAVVGTAGEPHEKGGFYKGERFEPRPFMVPALMKTKDRLPRHWADSVR